MYLDNKSTEMNETVAYIFGINLHEWSCGAVSYRSLILMIMRPTFYLMLHVTQIGYPALFVVSLSLNPSLQPSHREDIGAHSNRPR